MADNQITKTAGLVEKSENLVHWFIVLVGLTYACGFLIVFTFFKSFGIDSVDLIEAKYIHVGVLFILSCLVIAMPLWWLVWPLRLGAKSSYRRQVQKGMREITWRGRIKYFIFNPIKSLFFPDWSIDPTHGIHASWPVRISMILILWSFVSIVMFAPSNFGNNHSRLALFNFLIPMVVLVLGFFGDLFKGGELSASQHYFLKRARFVLRVWWLSAGVSYYVCFLISDYFRREVWILAVFMLIPVLIIIGILLILLNSNRGSNLHNAMARVDACLWALYAIQWTCVMCQICVFIWTIKRNTLDVSLFDVLFGNNYVPELRKAISSFDIAHMSFPHGGIYFVFFIILIVFFLIRNSYRLTQLTEDRSHQVATTVSMAAIVVPLFYVSILTFAYKIYPYIPYDKGGGDYIKCPSVRLTFNANAITEAGFTVVVPQELLSQDASNSFIILNEDESSVFLAATNTDFGGPADWRSDSKPTVYEVRREAISCITQVK